MVDIISNRLQEVYGSLRLPNVLSQNETNERPTIASLQRFGQEITRKRIEIKENEKEARDRSLYKLKEQPAVKIEPYSAPLRGLSCKHCAPTDSEQQLDPIERRRGVKDILRITQHAGRQPYSSNLDWGVWCPHLAQCVRLTKFPYPQVSDQVLKDERLLKAIDQATIESVNEKGDEKIIEDSVEYEKLYDEYKKKNEKRAKHIVIDMRSKISDLLLRITSWVLYKLLPCFLSGVAAHPAQIDMLRAATTKAPNTPLIFLPLHRSHLDYILISFILLNNDIRSPIVAAGNNLRIPFFGSLLRGLGAFFIKRKIDPIIGKKDIIYRAVLHTYLQKCLAAHHNVEFFIEGGRTRTGKPCIPKSGILSVIVDAFMDGTIEDALLVPVSVNYERLVDGHFVYEQMGKSKQPETFSSAMAAIWKTLRSRYGLMRIDFNEPFSLRELVRSFQKLGTPQEKPVRKLQHNPSTTSLYGTDVVHEEHRTLIDSIARHVIYDCASATSVMTTNAVAFLLLNRFRDGVSLNIFAEALDELRIVLETDRDIGFTGKSIDIINYAVELLGPEMILKEIRGQQIFIKPVATCASLIELSYYSNSLLPHFALESIILTAIHKTLKEEEETKPNYAAETIGIDKEEVLRKAQNHCDILRNEFIFCKPCQNMPDVFESTIERLCSRKLISMPEREENRDDDLVRMARRITYELNDDFDDADLENLRNREYIYVTSEGHCERIVLMTVLAPILNTYLSVAFCLNNLLGNCIIESEFVKVCLKEITERYKNGECKYGESISVDSIRNCIKLLEKWSVIEVSSSTGMRLLSLTNSYNSSYGVESVIEKIQNAVPFL